MHVIKRTLQVSRCPKAEVSQHITEADVAVPLMCGLNAELLRTAKRLKLIIQYGVGVEGIDIAQVFCRYTLHLPGTGT